MMKWATGKRRILAIRQTLAIMMFACAMRPDVTLVHTFIFAAVATVLWPDPCDGGHK
jgi:hypothetical protein